VLLCVRVCVCARARGKRLDEMVAAVTKDGLLGFGV
jgi:hypothetical protein